MSERIFNYSSLLGRCAMPLVIDIRNTDDVRDAIHRAVQALVEGGVVAVPTETVYGLAASALSERGVARLAEIKGRQAQHPFALAVKGVQEALDYVPDMSPLGRRLARRCWPGPITLVFDVPQNSSLLVRLPQSVRRAVAPNGTLGLRVPAHAAVLDVLKMMVGPLALTSANRRGQPESVTGAEVVAAVGDDVQLVLDDGPCRYGQASSVVRVREKDFEVLRAGVCSQQTLRRLASVMVVFVCTGNTCRSPMAEALFRHRMAQKLGCKPEELQDRGLVVMSAGIAAESGGRPSPEAVDVLKEMQLDLRGHESQPLTEQLVRHADYVIAMTQSHRQAIVDEWPEAAPRTHLLSSDSRDVADPIGGPLELYRRCADQIAQALERWVEIIQVP